MSKKILILLLILMAPLLALPQESPKVPKKEFASSSEAWKMVKKGNKYYKKNRVGGYRMAAKYYGKALDANEMCAPLLYRAGISELMSGSHKLAKGHLSDAADLSPSVASDALYWIAVSKQNLSMFKDAKSDFDDCMDELPEKARKKYSADISLRINQCENGLRLMKQQDMSVVQPLPGAVNSNMPEFAPVFCNLDSALYFSGKRKEGNVCKKPGKDLDPRADVYAAYTDNGEYTDVRNAGNTINTKKNEYPAYMNITGAKLCYGSHKNIYVTYKKSVNSRWKKGEKYLKNCVSVSWNSDSSMVIYTSAKGPDHQGGYDIYFMKRQGNKFSDPQNLGADVNSQYNDMWATFGAEDTVIYFATNSHLSVGGYDIMKTRFHNGKWQTPQNLGLGINSGADDNYFQLSAGDTRIGYFASTRDGGKGDYDIYRVLLFREALYQYPPSPFRYLAADYAKEPVLPLEEPEPIKTMRLTVVRGRITDFDHTRNLYSQISITDNSTNATLQTIMTNPETGEYVITLPSGKNYAMTVSSDGYLFHSENFNIPPATNYQEIRKDIGMLPMDPGSKVVLNNVFFDSNSSNLRPESYGELDRLAEIFKLYPGLVIEVSGHTDNQGNRLYNITLSQKRAEAVRQYLIDVGVQPVQVMAKGYGPDRPRDTNSTAEGRQNNRRVEAQILSN